MAVLLSGCGAEKSPVAPGPAVSSGQVLPSTAAAPTSLIVRVLTRGADEPIAGAVVYKNDVLVGRTNADGLVSASVTPGVEFHITVSASGYAGNGAWGTVAGEERWTFYLEPQP